MPEAASLEKCTVQLDTMLGKVSGYVRQINVLRDPFGPPPQSVSCTQSPRAVQMELVKELLHLENLSDREGAHTTGSLRIEAENASHLLGWQGARKQQLRRVLPGRKPIRR
ncbi:hypothetical protein ACIREO_22625 [Streptomyces sp. NPDC102441]|uniref:hypothetical protein n=1 Tax=Streptomyces sp. NPDC102441 TaxID=3366176 RepID=UPI0037F19DA3